MFDSEIPLMDMLFRLLAAAGLALLLGLERELRGKAAGLRSHMLVSLGASAFIMMGIHILCKLYSLDAGLACQVIENLLGKNRLRHGYKSYGQNRHVSTSTKHSPLTPV